MAAISEIPLKRGARAESWFYPLMGGVAVLIVLAGFGGTFYGVARGDGKMSHLVAVHTAIFAAWLVFFIAQTTLVARGNVAAHMRWGIVGLLLAVAMLFVGYLTSIAGIRRGFDLGDNNDPLGYAVFPMGDLVSFAILFTLGYIYRHQAQAHKRFMLLATIGALLNAPLAHFIAHTPALKQKGPLVILPFMIALLLASAIFDKFARGRIHPVSLWGAVALFL